MTASLIQQSLLVHKVKTKILVLQDNKLKF